MKTPKGVTVGHADHNLSSSHYELIDSVLEARAGGFFIEAVELPPECGDLQSALYGPAAGDAPVSEDDVKYVVRNNRPGPSRMVDRPLRPIRTMIVIGIAGAEPRIFTAYGGPTPSPREWWDSSMKPHEAVESAKFWSVHALCAE